MAADVTSPTVEVVCPHGRLNGSEYIKQVSQKVNDLSPKSGGSHYFSPANEEEQIRFASSLVAASEVNGSATTGKQAQVTLRQNTDSNRSSPSEWVLCSEYSTPPEIYSEKPAHLNCTAFPGLTQYLNSTTSTDSGGGVDSGFSAALAFSKDQAKPAQGDLLILGTGETGRVFSNTAANELTKFQWSSAGTQAIYPPATATSTFASDVTTNASVVPAALPPVISYAEAMEGQQRQRKDQQQQQQQPQQTQQPQHVGSAFANRPNAGTAYQGDPPRREAKKTEDEGFFGRRVPSRRCQWLRALPVVFLMVLVAYILAVFITYHILPELQLNVPDYLKKISRYNRGLVELVFTGITTFLFLLAYWLSVITPPGSIPNVPEWQATAVTAPPIDKGAAALETKKTGERRHCKWCRMLKPDRAHHCRVCRSCVLKMDHHCPWIYNCVGYKNHKYFLLSLIYGSLASLVIACCMFPSVRKASDSEQDFEKMFMLLFAETLDIFLCVLITGFLVFHLHLLRKGMTTIEFCEKQFKTPQSGSTESMWNKGVARNFIDAFGPNPLLWFIPIGTILLFFFPLILHFLLLLQREEQIQLYRVQTFVYCRTCAVINSLIFRYRETHNREGDGVTFLSEQTRLLHEDAEAAPGVRAFEPIIEGSAE